jgi:hypothetical protein
VLSSCDRLPRPAQPSQQIIVETRVDYQAAAAGHDIDLHGAGS